MSYELEEENIDAIGRLRDSSTKLLFSSNEITEKNTAQWDEETFGTNALISHDADMSKTNLDISGTAEAEKYVIRQSIQRFNSSGGSIMAFIQGYFGDAAEGFTKRIGLFTDDDGLFFQQDIDNLSVVVRSSIDGSPTDNEFTRDNWNIDKLDGTGPSKITLSLTDINTFVIDYSPFNTIRFGFFIEGKIYYCTEVSENLSLFYPKVNTFPIRYELRADINQATTQSVWQLHSFVVFEGIEYDYTENCGETTGLTGASINNSSTNSIISIRLNSGFLTSEVFLREINIFSTSTTNYVWKLIENPTTSIGGFARSGTTSVDVSTTSTAITGGKVLATGYGSSTNTVKDTVREYFENSHRLGSKIDNTAVVLVIAVEKFTGGGAATFYSSINWKEKK